MIDKKFLLQDVEKIFVKLIYSIKYNNILSIKKYLGYDVFVKLNMFLYKYYRTIYIYNFYIAKSKVEHVEITENFITANVVIEFFINNNHYICKLYLAKRIGLYDFKIMSINILNYSTISNF